MSTAPSAYDQAAGQVVDMMVSGLPFVAVEDAIDVTPVRQEEKTTLWHLAWSLRPRSRSASGDPADASRIDRAKLRDGSEIRIRPVEGQEAKLLVFLQALSPHSRRLRFGSTSSNLHQAARVAARADGPEHVGAVALDDTDRIVAHAACVRLEEARAEVAVAVDENRRHLGLATILLALMAREAEQHGIRDLTAEVQPQNFAMCSIFRDRFNASAHHKEGQGEIMFEFQSAAWRRAIGRFRTTV
jgi:ribosomal protein S18 acetylase RimI-like enzyme